MRGETMARTAAKQSQRELAYSAKIAQQCYSAFQSFGKVGLVAGRSSFCFAATSLYRYPFPDRPAYSPGRPITETRRLEAKKTADIGYHGGIAIHQGADRTNCGAAEITTIGKRSCTRNQSSLRPWPYLLCQVASETTLSVAWSVPVQASWPQKCLERIAPEQCLPVRRSASSVTTRASKSASKIDNRLRPGRAMNRNRRRGSPPAAVLSCFGDGK